MDYQLSEHAVKRLRERRIDEQWIQAAIDQPDRVEADPMDADAKHALKIFPKGRIVFFALFTMKRRTLF
jgi:hypothetical protein